MGGGSGGSCTCLVLVVLIASLVVVGGGRIFAVELLVVSVALPFRVLVGVGGGGVLVAVELVFGVVLVVDAVSVEASSWRSSEAVRPKDSRSQVCASPSWSSS